MSRTRVVSMTIAAFSMLALAACERRGGGDSDTVTIRTRTDTVRDTVRDTLRDTVRVPRDTP